MPSTEAFALSAARPSDSSGRSGRDTERSSQNSLLSMLIGRSGRPPIRGVSAYLCSATDSLQTAIKQLNLRDGSVLEKISANKLIESDKDALIKATCDSKKQNKISAIQALLKHWENQNEYYAKISLGYRQIVSRSSKTILSVEELTSFESDSHLSHK